MRFYKDKEVVSVEVVYGGSGTRQWHEHKSWWKKDVLHTEKFTKPTYVVIAFHDKECQNIFFDTNQEAEAFALKIKDRYNLINLKDV